MALYTFDPKRHATNFHGITLQGFQNGTHIEITRMAPTFTSEVGADGHVVRSRSHDRRATVKVTLQGSSPTNALLSALIAAAERGTSQRGDVGSFGCTDLNGTTVAAGGEAYLTKWPDFTVGTVHTARVWEFEVASCSLLIGGALV